MSKKGKRPEQPVDHTDKFTWAPGDIKIVGHEPVTKEEQERRRRGGD